MQKSLRVVVSIHELMRDKVLNSGSESETYAAIRKAVAFQTYGIEAL
jgi:hypothetical protein